MTIFKIKDRLIIIFFGCLTVFFLMALILWTIVPYFQTKVYFKERTADRLDRILKSNFMFSPFTYAQMFIRKDLLLHMVSISINKSNRPLFTKATVEVEKLLHYNGFQPVYYILLANAYEKESQISKDSSFLKKAENCYKKAIELSPRQQKLYYPYGSFLLNQGRNSEAYEILKQAFDLNNQARLSHFYLGLVEMTTGENSYEEVLDHLEFFFASDFRNDYEDSFPSPDPGWVVSKDAYQKFLHYFYEKKDKKRVLKVAERLSELDQAQSASFQRIVDIINNTGAMPTIEFIH